MDTIFALASARGAAGVAIVRISGPAVLDACDRLLGLRPAVRQATLVSVMSASGERLDQALAVRFEGPASFTGEDVLELNLHGSVAVVDAVLRELSALSGCRIAEPGEFTRRALGNGKMDLLAVEGLSDLIAAETEQQRKQAMQTYSGETSRFLTGLRDKLVHAAALLEATIDFADEEVPEDVTPDVVALVQESMAALRSELDRQKFAERVRTGFEVALIGPPNSGKSTLLNYLAGRTAAITSEVAGTTRDVIEVRMDLDGIPVTLLDTAGLRDAHDEVESIGIQMGRERADAADIRVWLMSPEEVAACSDESSDLYRVARCDLEAGASRGVSGKTGEGVQDLIQAIGARLSKRASNASLLTRERHAAACGAALNELQAGFGGPMSMNTPAEVLSEHLRRAARHLDIVLGKVDVENLLDVIFSKFCLGK